MRALLLGSDHTELGQVKVEAVGDHAALGLTRGRYRKSYRYVDPNEDVAAAVAGERATLLAVADAHNGVHAAETAIEEVLAAWGADPPPADVTDVELRDADPPRQRGGAAADPGAVGDPHPEPHDAGRGARDGPRRGRRAVPAARRDG